MKQKNILIFGLAKSGIASFELLYNKKNKFYLYDDNESVRNEIQEKTKDLLNVFIVKNLDNTFLEFLNLIVISPSISIYTPFIVSAKSKNIEVISELELGYRYCKNNILAITGTNGKTTTVNLINHIFLTAKKPSVMVGNMGCPLCSQVKKTPHKTTFICEVSSFQLEAICKFAPKECGILNITCDHISRHRNFNEYKNTKFKIFSNLKKGSKIVVNSNVLKTNSKLFETLKSQYKIYEFGFEKVNLGCYIENENIYFSNGKKTQIICDITKTNLIGKHNLENIMASICFAKFHKISNKFITKALQTFVASPHRIQKVYEHNNSLFYDDSKATNIDATIKAVNSFSKPLVLILGGSDKGYSYEDIFKNLPNNVCKVIACGEVGNKIVEAGKKYNYDIIKFGTLREATTYACSILESGQYLLLSPASASFDEFSSYKERGEKFLEYIKDFYLNNKVIQITKF